MTRIAHLSDLHFGAVDRAVAQELLDELRAYAADVCVVTGDLTQRATHDQFRLAREFLDALPSDALVVPGNHDVPPLYRPLRRMLRPFGRYRRYVHSDLAPIWSDGDTVVLGLNTVRPMRWKEGTLHPHVLQRVSERLNQMAPARRVLATHHPVRRPPGATRGRNAWQNEDLGALSVDFALSGHLHVAGSWAPRPVRRAAGVVLIQAPTATSTRRRGEPNGYNQIEIGRTEAIVHLRAWDGTRFETIRTTRFALPSLNAPEAALQPSPRHAPRPGVAFQGKRTK